jgi:hypothetical protein
MLDDAFFELRDLEGKLAQEGIRGWAPWISHARQRSEPDAAVGAIADSD